jgi:site-specific recombinase XerD
VASALRAERCRAFRRSGIDAARAPGALVHALRHTFATELANAGVSLYALMNLLGHESMTTSQRYVTAAGTDTRAAAATKRSLHPSATDESCLAATIFVCISGVRCGK